MKFLRWLVILSLFSFYSCDRNNSTSPNPSLSPVASLPDSIVLLRADSLYVLAEKITDLKRSDSALFLHKKVLEIREKLLSNDIRLLNSYYKVGMLYWRDNKFDLADRYLEKARQLREEVKVPFDVEFDIYYTLANCKSESKDFPTAISIMQRLLRMIHEQAPTDKIKLARAYGRLASIYRYAGQTNSAFKNWATALDVAPKNDHESRSEILFSLSILNSSVKNFEGSKKLIDESLSESLKVNRIESKPIADRYLWKAFVLLDLNQLDSVPFHLYKALAIRKKIFGKKDSYVYGVQRGIAEYFSRIGKADSALFYQQESLVSLLKDFNDHNSLSNPKPNIDESTLDLVQSIVDKAATLKTIGEQDSSQVRWFDLSLNTYLLADSVFANYRKKILHDDPIMLQLENQEIPFGDLFDLVSTLLKKNEATPYFEKAFRAMESSRAIVLQNALSRASAFNSTGVPDSLRDKENGFMRHRAELIQALGSPGLSKSAHDSLNDDLFVTNNHEVDLQRQLGEISPNYFAVKYQTLPALDDMKKFLLEQNSIFLEYYWSDSTLYALMISGEKVRFAPILITKEFKLAFRGFIQEFRSDIEGAFEFKQFNFFCRNSSTLYNYLLKDFLADAEAGANIIISANGPLSTLPFEALIAEVPITNEVNYRLPYVVTRHAISYAYSASVLLKQCQHRREGKKILAFGYAGKGITRTARDGTSNLPGTEKEVMAIKDVMKNDVNKYNLEGKATESLFKKQARNYDIIHLAVHGEGDTVNALNSRLIFRTDNEVKEDGSLYAHELYDLRLDDLDLAVLSACESGIGKQQSGEGILSIARGFAYAGCPSQIVSLWKIDDRTSAQVMGKFYRYLSTGTALNVSLSKAKVDYINGASELNSHPFYWAAFLQVGDPRELDMKKPNWWSWVLWVGLISVALIAVVSWWRGSYHRRG